MGTCVHTSLERDWRDAMREAAAIDIAILGEGKQCPDSVGSRWSPGECVLLAEHSHVNHPNASDLWEWQSLSLSQGN